MDQQTARHADRDVAVLAVRGEIDLATAPVLLEALLPVLDRDTGPVVIDLSEVPFMDSSGIHLLVDVLRRLDAQGRRLAIACREDGQVHLILRLVGLLDSLNVHHSRESAVAGGDSLIRA